MNDYGEPVVLYKLGLWHFETFNVSERVCTNDDVENITSIQRFDLNY